jgi:MFS family permease
MLRTLSFGSYTRSWFQAFIPYKVSEAIFSLLFPLYLVNVLDLQVGTVGLLTALISLTAVPGSMLWGYLSDQRKQRRAYVVLGCVGSAGSLMAMALVQTVTPMILLCLIYGLFSIAPAPVSSVLIMETNAEEQWEECFGTFHKIGGWSWVVGLTLGTGLLPVLQAWWSPGMSMRLALLGLGMLTLLSAWWAHRTIPTSRHHASRHQYLTVTGRLPHHSLIEQVLYLPRRLLFVLHPSHLPQLRHLLRGDLACYLWITAAVFLSSNLAFTPFPLFVQDVLHMSTTHLFIFAWVRMLVATLCYEPAGHWAHHLGPQRGCIMPHRAWRASWGRG